MAMADRKDGPSAKTAVEKFDQQLFDRIADQYALKDFMSSTRICRAAILQRAVEPIMAENQSLGHVVDVGCGVGAQAVYLAGCFESYIGVDYSNGLIELGREILSDVDDAELLAANIKDAPLPDQCADTVVLVGAFHHMSDIPDVMTALKRIAKPGAKLVAIEPQRANPFIQLMRRVRMKLDASYSSDQQFFSREEVIAFLSAAEMRDIVIEYQGFLTPPFAQVILNPQWLFARVSKAVAKLEPAAEWLLPGPASWNLVAYAVFP